jgi:outer membrane protein W
MKRLAIATLALLAINAHANGTTANGCTYQVINGKYIYSCEKQVHAEQATAAAAAPAQVQAPAQAPAPVANTQPANGCSTYNCDVKAPNQERIPTVQANEATVIAAPAAPTMAVPVMAPPVNQAVRYDNVTTVSASPTSENSKKPLDAIYVGAHVGSANIMQDGEAATGLGLSVFMNVDEQLGFELGYTYASKDIYLGLANRAGTAPVQQSPYGNGLQNQTDASLTTHLFSGEAQFFLTDYNKRLRPFAGIGLGWKNSSLDEKTTPTTSMYGQTAGNGSLSQSSLGAVASLGAKLSVAKNILASIVFRAYRPFSKQNATLSGNQPTYGAMGPTASSSRLNTADSVLTEAGLHEIVGGLHIAF